MRRGATLRTSGPSRFITQRAIPSPSDEALLRVPYARFASVGMPVILKLWCEMARPERFELPTFWFVARRSIQLSYGRTREREEKQ
jgi:hypothetical protein